MPAFVFFLRFLAALLIAAAGSVALLTFDERFPLEPGTALIAVLQGASFGILVLFFASVVAASYRVKSRLPLAAGPLTAESGP